MIGEHTTCARCIINYQAVDVLFLENVYQCFSPALMFLFCALAETGRVTQIAHWVQVGSLTAAGKLSRAERAN